jgi:hypothetical protein
VGAKRGFWVVWMWFVAGETWCANASFFGQKDAPRFNKNDLFWV